ncbi:MAG TPA: dimethylsulfoniopropionate demethylase [Thermohalobaculum sp.]|nr:dimethylsulfoniopropionate demethylase [Thermohalobaculum sp.]
MAAYLTPSPRVRRSPFFDATVADGVKSFSIYNHMYMPTGFGDPMAEYWRLINGVAMWDVAVERQVELKGPDAGRLAQMLCPRKLDTMKPGQGWYVPICDHNGILLNDPILLKLAEDRYWLSIADSDLLLWAKAVAAERSLEVAVTEPDVSPLAVQGPKAVEVIADLFGEDVRKMGYFRFLEAEIDGIPVLLQRSGWSKQGGFELYLRDGRMGTQLWNMVKEAGRPHGIGPGCPNGMERIESGLLSFGGDTDAETNPYEVRLGKYVDLDAPEVAIGLPALRLISEQGPKRHQLGIELDIEERLASQDRPSTLLRDGTAMGKMTANTWSPRMEANIGMCLVSVDLNPGDTVTVELPEGRQADGRMCELPFL